MEFIAAHCARLRGLTVVLHFIKKKFFFFKKISKGGKIRKYETEETEKMSAVLFTPR